MQTPAGLPFSGSSLIAAHASHQGAEDAKKRAPQQLVVYLKLLWLAYPDGLTDAEAAEQMQVERSTVNARRGQLVGMDLLETYGRRTRESSGNPNTVYRLKLPAGR
jgi:predicted ArsR family transcriptional regulator